MWEVLRHISGALMSIQGVLMGGDKTEQPVGIYRLGTTRIAVCVLAWLFTGETSIAALWQIENKYVLLGGVIGCF